MLQYVEVAALNVVAKETADAGALDVAAEELGVVVVVVDVEGVVLIVVAVVIVVAVDVVVSRSG